MIHEYEDTLRRLIIEVIGSEDSSPYKVSAERIKKWKETRDIELKSYNNVLAEPRLLYYSEFFDLCLIIDKNWELFLPILKEKKRFDVFFSEVESFRNTVAHGRNLTLSQENLLSGITSDLKHQITIYHNKNEMKDDFFMRIIKVNDNFGNDLTTINRPYQTLRVGDELEIFIEANDPKDRKIQYQIYSLIGELDLIQDTNRFRFTITKELVAQASIFKVIARTPDSEYINQDSAHLYYTVLPKKD